MSAFLLPQISLRKHSGVLKVAFLSLSISWTVYLETKLLPLLFITAKRSLTKRKPRLSFCAPWCFDHLWNAWFGVIYSSFVWFWFLYELWYESPSHLFILPQDMLFWFIWEITSYGLFCWLLATFERWLVSDLWNLFLPVSSRRLFSKANFYREFVVTKLTWCFKNVPSFLSSQSTASSTNEPLHLGRCVPYGIQILFSKWRFWYCLVSKWSICTVLQVPSDRE